MDRKDDPLDGISERERGTMRELLRMRPEARDDNTRQVDIGPGRIEAGRHRGGRLARADDDATALGLCRQIASDGAPWIGARNGGVK